MRLAAYIIWRAHSDVTVVLGMRQSLDTARFIVILGFTQRMINCDVIKQNESVPNIGL